MINHPSSLKVGCIYRYESHRDFVRDDGLVMLRTNDIVIFLERQDYRDRHKTCLYKVLLPCGLVQSVVTSYGDRDDWFLFNFSAVGS
jgi:hypothetical protein